MTTFNKAILKVAKENPEFRRALVAELKQARGLHERQIFNALLADFKTGMEGEPDASAQAAMPGVLAASERKIGAILKGMQKKLPPGANWARQPVFHTLAEEIAEFALHLGWLHS